MFSLKYFKYITIPILALLLGACTETTNQVRPTRSTPANNVTSTTQRPTNSYVPTTKSDFARGTKDNIAPRGNDTEHRLALVIGNNDYQHPPLNKLRNAVNDAKAIRVELTKRDFKVLYHINATRKQMLDAADDFIQQLSSDTIALVFYAGHGMQIKGDNYLLPVDLVAKEERDVVHDGINLRKLLNDMGAKQTKFSLAVIDACRNNPLKGHGRSVGTRGLTNPGSTGVVVMYSAGENQQALDRLSYNDPNPNGLFTREFLKAIREPGLTARDVIQKTRKTVYEKAKAVGHNQMPALYDQSIGSFVFTPGLRREEQRIKALEARVKTAEKKAQEAEFTNQQTPKKGITGTFYRLGRKSSSSVAQQAWNNLEQNCDRMDTLLHILRDAVDKTAATLNKSSSKGNASKSFGAGYIDGLVNVLDRVAEQCTSEHIKIGNFKDQAEVKILCATGDTKRCLK